MGKIDKFYEKINGSYFAFLGAGISLISIFIAFILYIAVDPTFTIITHYISDLGDGQNYSNIVFNVGRIISGIIMFFFFLHLTRLLQNSGINKKLVIISFISGLMYSIGMILVGVFPSKAAPLMHVIAAAITFFGMFFIYIFFGISDFRISGFSRKPPIAGLIFSPLPLLFMLSVVLLHTVGFDSRITFFTEWLTYFAMMSWIITQGIYTMRRK